MGYFSGVRRIVFVSCEVCVWVLDVCDCGVCVVICASVSRLVRFMRFILLMCVSVHVCDDCRLTFNVTQGSERMAVGNDPPSCKVAGNILGFCCTYVRLAKCAYAQAQKHPILRPEDKQTVTPVI